MSRGRHGAPNGHGPSGAPAIALDPADPGAAAVLDAQRMDSVTAAAVDATMARFSTEALFDDEAAASATPAEWAAIQNKPLPPGLGWRRRGAGRSAFAPRLTRWVGSTHNLPGLYPFVLSGGAPSGGVPIGRHMITNEPIGLDGGEWLRDGLITNTGIYVTSEPGVGKSTLCRRLVWGLSAFGTGILCPVDLKGEHGPLIQALGGTVVHLGRGMNRINLLDPGPLADVLRQLPAGERVRLEQEMKSRSLLLVEGSLLIANGRRLSDAEQLALAAAYDVFMARTPTGTVPDLGELMRILRELPEQLQTVFMVDTRAELADIIRPLVIRIELMLSGPMAGLFDRQSTFTIDADTPGVCLDLSRLENEAVDSAVAIAMLAAWGWCSSLVDAGQQMADIPDPDTGQARGRRNWLQLFDEHWRVMRAGAGMVELSDRVTRFNRHRGVQSVMVTHSLDDFKALPTEEDRNKARGMVARCAITICGAHRRVELDALSEISPLTSQEKDWISSWSAPPTWVPGADHPGRGKWMIKTGERLGIPVNLSLLPGERKFSETDTAWQLAGPSAVPATVPSASARGDVLAPDAPKADGPAVTSEPAGQR